MKTEKRRLQRLWNNLVSLRDYNVEKWIENNITVIVTCGDRPGQMTITPDILRDKGFRTVSKTITSKYSKPYKLIDYRWREDEDNNTRTSATKKEQQKSVQDKDREDNSPAQQSFC